MSKKKTDAYVNMESFQFITDFRNEYGFNDLTITQRIMLSAYLTCIVNDGICESSNNIYKTTFNFTESREDSAIMSYKFTQEFMVDFTVFLKNNPGIFKFVKDNAFTLDEDGNTVIKRTQLNKSEYDVLLKSQFRRNYLPFATALYILGVSKMSITTKKLNQFPIDNLYKNNRALARARTRKLFEAMNYEENINYIIKNNTVFFGNGFSKELETKYFSKKKKEFEETIEIEEIIKVLSQKKIKNKKTEITTIPESKEISVEKNVKEKTIESNWKSEEIDLEENSFITDEDLTPTYDAYNPPPTRDGLTKQMLLDYAQKNVYGLNTCLAGSMAGNKYYEKILILMNNALYPSDKNVKKYIENNNYYFDDLEEKNRVKETIKRSQMKILRELNVIAEENIDEYRKILPSVAQHKLWKVNA